MAMTREEKEFGTIPYLKYLPPTNPVKGNIMFLHGIGQVGTNLDVLESLPIPKLYAQGTEKDYATYAPQLTAGTGWSLTSIKYLLELCEKQMLETGNDINILSGLSLGGFTGLILMKEAHAKYGHNHFFSAVGLMCAKINSVSTFDVTPYIGTPIKLWHGTTDTTNVISNMRTFRDRVNAGGGDVELVEYPGVGHNVWDIGYQNANFWAFADEYGEVQTADEYAEGYAAGQTAGYATGNAAGIITGTAQGRAALKAQIAAL
jgi:pimeloyl-ACP methyl ester carboxylesterase